MVPQMCKGGLIDYELMIRNNFIENMKLIIFFLQKNNLYPIYIVVKKIYNKNKLFLSMYKKMVVQKYGLRR